MPALPPPGSCEELLAQMVSFETVNPSFGGPAGGEAALAAHLESLAAHWGLKSRRCPVADGTFNLLITAEVASRLQIPVTKADLKLDDKQLTWVNAMADATSPMLAAISCHS